MAVDKRILAPQGLGPNLENEIVAAGLGGKSWVTHKAGPDSYVDCMWSYSPEGNELSYNEAVTLEGVVAAHDPGTPYEPPSNQVLIQDVVADAARLLSYPENVRPEQDHTKTINGINTLRNGGVQ